VTSETDLSSVLGAAPPASVAALPTATLDRLTAQIVASKKQHEVEMEASVQTAIDGVPFAVRGLVKKAVLG